MFVSHGEILSKMVRQTLTSPSGITWRGVARRGVTVQTSAMLRGGPAPSSFPRHRLSGYLAQRVPGLFLAGSSREG